MHRFENLKIWKKALGITESYHISNTLIKEIKYRLTSQLRQNAISIPLNIAKGLVNINDEFRLFLGVANGSFFELLPQFYLSKKLNLIQEDRVIPIVNEVLEVTKVS